MKLGAFSVSLSVKNLTTSQDFYAALGFRPVAGVPEDGWVILRNETCTVGLFQGMFDGNMLTFNPGWSAETELEADFTDIRAIQKRLKGAGVEIEQETDPAGAGPAHILVRDPDGNAVFLDQHVPAPVQG